MEVLKNLIKGIFVFTLMIGMSGIAGSIELGTSIIPSLIALVVSFISFSILKWAGEF